MEAIPYQVGQYMSMNAQILIFDKEEHLLWKSGIKESTLSRIINSLLKDFPNSEQTYGVPIDILGYSKTDENRYAKAEDLFQEGLSWLSKHDYKQAKEMFTQTIKLNPHNAFAYKYRAIASYNMSKFKDALPDIRKAMILDPFNRQNDTLYSDIMTAKYDKFMRTWGPGGTMDRIAGVLNSVNQSLAASRSSATTTYNNTASTPTVTSTSAKTSGKQEICTACNGTGYNLAKERPAFYDHTTEDFSSQTCDICGSSTNHYHKSCPSCAGKGYRIRAF